MTTILEDSPIRIHGPTIDLSDRTPITTATDELPEPKIPEVFREVLEELDQAQEARVGLAQISGKTEESKGRTPQPIEDEYSAEPAVNLKPLPRDPRSNPALEEEFSYLSRTRRIEVETDRVQILQDIVDKMTDGENVTARIVILNKGNAPTAFVHADGTIFVSQSLINRLDYLDEVGQVLAHEINHLLIGTPEKVARAQGSATRTGVSWLHEGVSDVLVSRLLEKAGLNPMVTQSTVQKIAWNTRDTVHQAGVARGAQHIGGLKAINYRTSHQEPQAIPNMLTHEPAYTNMELVNIMLSEGNINGATDALAKLHPRDLHNIYSSFIGVGDRTELTNLVRAYNGLVSRRCSEAGYTDAETRLFLITRHDKNYPADSETLIQTPEMMRELAGSINDYQRSQRFEEAYRNIFGYNSPYGFFVVGERYLGFIRTHMYDTGRATRDVGAPVTQDTLLDTLSTISPILDERDRGIVSHVIRRFIDVSLVPSLREGKINDENLVNFFQSVKERGLLCRRSDVEPMRYSDVPRPKTLDIYEPVLRAYDAVFPMQTTKSVERTRPLLTTDMIDSLIAGSVDTRGEFSSFTFNNELNRLLWRSDLDALSDEQRLALLEYFSQRIDAMDLPSRRNLLSCLENGPTAQVPTEHPSRQPIEVQEANQAINRFNLKALTGMVFFPTDTKTFYEYMTRTMEASGIDYASLTKTQLLNLWQGMTLLSPNRASLTFDLSSPHPVIAGWQPNRRIVSIRNIDAFCELPIMQELLSRDETAGIQDIGGLNEYAEMLYRRQNLHRLQPDTITETQATAAYALLHLTPDELRDRQAVRRLAKNMSDLYDDNPWALIVGRDIRARFAELAQGDIPEDQFDEVYEFAGKFFPEGPRKKALLRNINATYLSSEAVPLQAKIDYLVTNFDRVGPEGLVMVAEHITRYEDYVAFRERLKPRLEKYLEGSDRVTSAAALDSFSASFVKGYEKLFNTCRSSTEDRRTQSTRSAEEWLWSVFSPGQISQRLNGMIQYDKATNRFRINSDAREGFRSISDIFAELHGLTPMQRFGVAMKALTERGGALTSNENRTKFGKIVTEALGIKPGLIRTAIEYGCQTIDPSLLSLSAAQAMSPMLFRSLQTEDIDGGELKNRGSPFHDQRHGQLWWEKGLPGNRLPELLSLDTRSLTHFGRAAGRSRTIDGLVQSSAEMYSTSFDTLEQRFGQHNDQEDMKRKAEQASDPAVEAVIQGIESGGSIGQRSLQLGRQLFRFSPEIDRRLARSFDANKGLNKLLFWENLHKLRGEDSRVGTFVADQLVEVRGYLGGGSQYTTYEAIATLPDGTEEEVVLKMLNPNAIGFVGKVYGAANGVLHHIATTGTKKEQEQARAAMTVLDLAKEWTLRDIGDQRFAEDDDVYREGIQRYNEHTGVTVFKVPERRLTTQELKVEQKVNRRTANGALSDPSVDGVIKRALVDNLRSLFEHELNAPIDTDERGSEIYMLRSDPHVGNATVDLDGNPTGIIDRHLYLRLHREDVELVRSLYHDGGNVRFLGRFIDRMLTINNVNNSQDRRSAHRGMMMSLMRGYVGHALRRNAGPGRVAQLISTECERRGLDIPLELRLALKNVESIKNLVREYSPA